MSSEQEDYNKVAKALSEAQEEITALKDRQREERLGWIVAIVIVMDCALLLNADNAGGPIVIGVLQLAALSVLAVRMGVEEFAQIFKGALNRVTDGIAGRE